MSEGFFVNTSRLTGCFNLVSLLENRLDLFRIQDCLAVLGGESVAWSQIIKIQKGFPPHGTSRMGNVVIVISFTIDPLWRCVFFLCLKIYPKLGTNNRSPPKRWWFGMYWIAWIAKLYGCHPMSLRFFLAGHWAIGRLVFLNLSSIHVFGMQVER